MQLTIVLVFIIASVKCSYAEGPILIVPGLTASPLLAKVQQPQGKLDPCAGEYIFWIGSLQIQPCIPRIVTLRYDGSHYHNNTGVEVEPYKFGEADSIKYMAPGMNRFKYFYKFIEHFGADHDVRAAPYDWRLAADELDRIGYYQKVKELIEDMYNDNNRKAVTIVAHSMGGPVSLYFLNNIVTQDWKDQYIHAFVPLSGAWAGANDLLSKTLSGFGKSCSPTDTSIFCFVYRFMNKYFPNSATKLDEAAFSLQSVQWLLPNPAVWGNEVLVTVNKDQHYTAHQMTTLFTMFGRNQQFLERFKGIFNIGNIFQSPNVPTYCLYGVGVSTPEKFHYDNGVTQPPRIETGDGDNTISKKGSEVCLNWKEQSAHFSSETFDGVGHAEIIKNDNVFKKIESILSRPVTHKI